jgi:hypothetical protein
LWHPVAQASLGGSAPCCGGQRHVGDLGGVQRPVPTQVCDRGSSTLGSRYGIQPVWQVRVGYLGSNHLGEKFRLLAALRMADAWRNPRLAEPVSRGDLRQGPQDEILLLLPGDSQQPTW